MNDDGDLEQQQQEDALFPWLADESMADPPQDYYDAPEHDDGVPCRGCGDPISDVQHDESDGLCDECIEAGL